MYTVLHCAHVSVYSIIVRKLRVVKEVLHLFLFPAKYAGPSHIFSVFKLTMEIKLTVYILLYHFGKKS